MAQWLKVASVDEFDQADRKWVDLGDGRQIGVFKVGNEYFAIDAWCSHAKASLMTGEIQGYEIICPAHGARFDLRTGRHLSFPAVRPIRSYRVRLNGSDIEAEV